MLFSDNYKLDSQRVYTDEGFLKVPAKFARTGIQEYYAIELGLEDREPDEVVRVYRQEGEVFKQNSLDSFKNKTVTDDHPAGLVDATNYKEVAVGHSCEDVRKEGDYMVGTLIIKDLGTIRKIENGKVELSNGYTSDIVWVKGVAPDGQRYEAIQTNIVGNHIAVVDNGRAGPECKIADGKLKGETMQVVIDGKSYECPAETKKAIDKLSQKLADAEAEMAKKDKDMEEMDEEMKEKDEEMAKKDKEMEEKDEEMEKKDEEHKKSEDSLKAKIKALKERVNDTALIDQRIKLIDTAKRISNSVQWDGKSNLDIMRQALSDHDSSLDLEGKSEDYVTGIFDAVANKMGTDLDRTFRSMANGEGGSKPIRLSDEARNKKFNMG